MNPELPQNQPDHLERSLAAMRNAPIPDGPSPQLLADTLAALRGAASQNESLKIKRISTMKFITRIAAALLLMCGIAALLFFAAKTSSVAFADVVQKVKDAKTLTFNGATTLPGMGKVNMKFFVNSASQTRVEVSNLAVTIIDPAAGKILNLQPQSKMAILMDMSGDTARKQPGNFVEELKNLDTKKAKDLGEKEIAGRACKGFIAEDKGTQISVWADKASGALVQIELDMPAMGGIGKMVMTDFVFDPPLDASLFSLTPPEGYKLQTLDMSKAVKAAQSATGEEHVIEVLRGYAEYNNGKFPEKLNGDWGIFAGMVRNKAAQIAGEKPALDDKHLQLMMHVGALLPFLNSLPKEDWDYLGNGITLGEKDKIVFWHKDQTSKKYRAVYGDLTAKEIEPANLPAKK